MRRVFTTMWAAGAVALGLAPGVPAGATPLASIRPSSACPQTPTQALRAAKVLEYRRGVDNLPRKALTTNPESGVVVPPAAPPAPARNGPIAVVVTYENFPDEARVAFDHAVDIWKTHLSSAVPITIRATFDQLDPGILGGASPSLFVRERDGTTPWYPIALAEALLGRELMPSSPDVVAQFNADPALWYFGQDGRPPADKYDFSSVVLHELGHGLGMTGDFSYDAGIGAWGRDLGDTTPTIFDTFVADSTGRSLVTGYPNRSEEMGRQLAGDGLTFNGPRSTVAAGGPPGLFSPVEWADGTSVYHTNPVRGAAGLMDPALGRGLGFTDTGLVIDAIFRDLGWPAAVPGPPADVTAVAADGSVFVSWTPPAETGGSPLTGYTVTLTPPTGTPVTAAATGSPTVVSGLINGVQYEVRVAAANASGLGPDSAFATATPVGPPPTPVTTVTTAPPPPPPPAPTPAPAHVVPAPTTTTTAPPAQSPSRTAAAAAPVPASSPEVVTADPCPEATSTTPTTGKPVAAPEGATGMPIAAAFGPGEAGDVLSFGRDDYMKWFLGAGLALLVAGEATRRRTLSGKG